MWSIRLLCCAIAFCRLGIEILIVACRRRGVACCGRSLHLRLRLLQLQSHLDQETSKHFEIWNKTSVFLDFETKVSHFRTFLVLFVFRDSGSSTRMSCRFPGVFGGETCEVTCKSPWSSEFGVFEVSRVFHSFLMSFSKPFLFKPICWELFNGFSWSIKHMGFLRIYFVQGFRFFFLLCFQEGTVKGECCEALCGAPKHHCNMSRSEHWSSARLSGKPA